MVAAGFQANLYTHENLRGAVEVAYGLSYSDGSMACVPLTGDFENELSSFTYGPIELG